MDRWLRSLAVACYLTGPALASAIPATRDASPYPVRTLAGVSVIDTPTVRAAQDLVAKFSSEYVYNHIMRSWLFGALIVKHNETLAGIVDIEVHAVSAILHDLGWDQNSPFVSADKRFEVDGAIAATDFIRSLTTTDHSTKWDDQRLQLVWDSIALHDQPSIADYKEPVVQVVSKGILSDFAEPEYGITDTEYQAVLDAFPRTTFKDGFNQTMIWLCQTKPATTWDTWMQPWGDAYVAGYSAVGHRFFDLAAELKPGI